MLEEKTKLNNSLESLLKPKSIAVVGASADRGKIGSLPITFLKRYGYAGSVYPINPKEKEIEGWKCYPSVSDIPKTIDLLVVAVAASRIPDLLMDCEPGKVKSALILSSGYAETGAEGSLRQKELCELAHQKGIRLVGPNSVGVVNMWQGVVPAISQVFDQKGLEPGPIAFVTQSGALGTAITAIAHEEGVKLGYFVSTGNEADLDFSDFCQFFIEDPNVKIIAGYVEGIRDGAKFQRMARQATIAGKPIVLLKVGRTEVGNQAAKSHTGALTGSDEIYQSIFEENGVIRAESIEEMFDYLKIFSCFPAESRSTKKVAVLSHSGGAGVLMADKCINEGLDMPPLSDKLKETLAKRLPSYASLQNPVDMTANVVFNPDVMSGTVYDVIKSREYDASMLCVNLIWRQGDALANELLAAKKETSGDLAVAWIAGLKDPIKKLNENGIPVYSDPIRCAKAVATKVTWDCTRNRIMQTSPLEIEMTNSSNSPFVGETFVEQESLLQKYQIPLAPAELTHSVEEAREAARRLGYPIALKLIAPGLLHKSDIGGVITGVKSDEELQAAYERLHGVKLKEVQLEGILVQKMVSNGVELFAGVKRDPVFGPITVFGLGGIYVEILKETILRPAPFSVDQAMETIRKARFFPLLDGARGRQKCDVLALAQLLSQLSILSVKESVEAIDLNPIIALPQSAAVVDFKFEYGSGLGKGE